MDRTPQAYEPTYEPRVETTEFSTTFNAAFLKSRSGILKICEVVLSCIVLICVACTTYWSYHSSGGWVNFVAAISLTLCTLLIVFYVFNVIRRLPGPWVIIEFVILIVFAFFWAISFIVSLVNRGFGGGAIAAAVFSIITMVVFIVELATRFRVTRENNVYRITIAAVRTVAPPYPTSTMAASTVPVAPSAGGYPGGYAAGSPGDGYVMP